LRFDADDFGRAGDDGGASDDVDCNDVFIEALLSEGTRLERTREADLLFGGDALRSMAEADRAGGGATLEVDDVIELLRPGDTV
jgi:hypothetical protein